MNDCDFCRPNSAGDHEDNCPNKPTANATSSSVSFATFPLGWACPRCFKVHAPNIHHCICTRSKCFLCDESSDMLEPMPYGSRHDGTPVCNKCIAKHLDPLIDKVIGIFNE